VAIILPQLAKDVSIVSSFKFILHVHRQANCYSETYLWKLFERIMFTLRHLQSFVVQNIEKSKASVAVVVSCFATVKASIQSSVADALWSVHSFPYNSQKSSRNKKTICTESSTAPRKT